MRGGRAERPSWVDAFYTIVTKIWLPAAALSIPTVYVIRLLFF